MEAPLPAPLPSDMADTAMTSGQWATDPVVDMDAAEDPLDWLAGIDGGLEFGGALGLGEAAAWHPGRAQIVPGQGLPEPGCPMR